ncbi:MAG TPA: hypothetical protein VHX68_01080, partial [Planctomycetaceae bacterium]|nr:hypothetical protein [Planctomycetaceae bacterium]
MRFGTLQSSAGPIVVGVHSESGNDRFVDLHAADPGLPVAWTGILAESGGLDRAKRAMTQG